MPYKEFLGKSTYHNNKIYVPIDITKKFNLRNGDKVIWSKNISGEIILSKNISNNSAYPY